MRNKLFILLACFFLVATTQVQGQNYNSAIGVKLGYGLIASYKKFLNEKAAVDIFGGIRWGGLAAGVYYELHYDISGLDRLQWYWGGGATFTTRTYGVTNEGYYELGVSGVLGLDYSFENIPLNLSVDWAPTVVLLNSYTFGGHYGRFRSGFGALTARYILN